MFNDNTNSFFSIQHTLNHKKRTIHCKIVNIDTDEVVSDFVMQAPKSMSKAELDQHFDDIMQKSRDFLSSQGTLFA